LKPQISIEEFLELTGIRFMDELTVPRRSIYSSDHQRTPRPVEEIPMAETAVAIAIDAPQLVLYSRVCQDLEAWMEKSKSEFRQAEEEAAKVTPELFVEYTKVDEESQEELKV
jgi:kinetochore protein Spc7/SPC105